MELHSIVFITERANHTLHYKSKVACTVAYRKVCTAREKWFAYKASRDQMAASPRFHSVDDDFGAVFDVDLNAVNVQMADLTKEQDVTVERHILALHADIEKADRTNDDPKLKAAQSRAIAKSRLVT